MTDFRKVAALLPFYVVGMVVASAMFNTANLELPGTTSSVLLGAFTAADITINNWQALLEVTAEKAGTYTIACTGVDGDRFGIGKPVSSTPFWALGVGGLAALASLVFFVVGARRK